MHIPPRDERFEFIREMGTGLIQVILEHKPLDFRVKTNDGGQALQFTFPERWMSTQEEYIFYSKVATHPQIKNAKMTIIDLITKSPLIIGNFLKDDILIFRADDS